jgi:DNA-binding NtrC family response regulator
MPDTDGVSLLKEWGSQGLLDMPVVMMSGHATIDTAMEATRIGALSFLEKPIPLQRLLKTISAALSHNQAVQPVPVMASLPVRPLENDLEVSALAMNGVEESLPNSGLLGSISLDQPLREARDAFERIYFEYHLVRENHSMTRVSERTGLERTHLYRKLKQLRIESMRKRSL